MAKLVAADAATCCRSAVSGCGAMVRSHRRPCVRAARRKRSVVLMDSFAPHAFAFERRAVRTSIVLINAFAPLVPLLRLDGERGDRACLEPLERDRLAGLFAVAVGAVLEAGQRLLDLGDQLALAVARAQLDGAIGLRGGAIGKVGMILILVLEMLQRLLGLFQNLFFPVEELLAEVLALAV